MSLILLDEKTLQCLGLMKLLNHYLFCQTNYSNEQRIIIIFLGFKCNIPKCIHLATAGEKGENSPPQNCPLSAFHKFIFNI